MEGNYMSISNSIAQCPDINFPMTREGLEFGIKFMDYLAGNLSSAKFIAAAKEYMTKISPNVPTEALFNAINEQVAACSAFLGYL